MVNLDHFFHSFFIFHCNVEGERSMSKPCNVEDEHYITESFTVIVPEDSMPDTAEVERHFAMRRRNRTKLIEPACYKNTLVSGKCCTVTGVTLSS